MRSRRNIRWIIIGGAACLGVFMSLGLLSRTNDSPTSTSSISGPSQNATSLTRGTTLTQDITLRPSTRPAPEEEKGQSASPPKAPSAVPQFDDATRHRIIAGLNATFRNAATVQYGSLFQQLQVPSDLQEKVINILTQTDRELAQQAFDAAQSGRVPAPPSPEVMRAQQLQQDQQLRSVLGDARFAEFNQYRETFPDRMIVNQMNQAGANLSENQSQQLLEVLSQTRRQIINQASLTQNWVSMPPDQAMTIIQQQEALRQQAVSNRVQNVLNPEQARTLQAVLARPSLNQKAQ